MWIEFFLEPERQIYFRFVLRFRRNDGHRNRLFLSHAVKEVHLLILKRMFVHVSRHADVLETVVLQFLDLPFSPKLHGLKSVSALPDSKRRLRNVIKLHAEADALFDLDKKVDRWKFHQIAGVVFLHARIIESKQVVSDDPIRPFQSWPQLGEIFFEECFEGVRFIKITPDKRDIEERSVIGADILEGVLCLDVENDFLTWHSVKNSRSNVACSRLGREQGELQEARFHDYLLGSFERKGRMSGQRRLVLLPLGRSWSAASTLFTLEEFLHACNADMTFMPEGLEQESAHVFLREYAEILERYRERDFIVAVCSARSIGELLSIRGYLVGDLPFLLRAFWILFVRDELEEGCRFWWRLKEQGIFEGSHANHDEIVTWRPHANPTAPFVVIRTETWNIDDLKARCNAHFGVGVERVTIPAAAPEVKASLPAIPSSPRPPASLSSFGLRLAIPKGRNGK
jgi:hypothetical protein